MTSSAEQDLSLLALEAKQEAYYCPELSQCPGIEHAFLSRNGGVSSGEFYSLNGSMTHDNEQDVSKNLLIVANAMSVHPTNLKLIKQIHSSKVIKVSNASEETDKIEGDAILTKVPEVVLAVKTADCVPVLLYDPTAKIIAAVHAGWRGAVGGIIGNTIDLMQKEGSVPANIIASIGPCIRQSHYEVSKNYKDNVTRQDPTATHYFSALQDEKFLFNLPGYVTSLLQASGVKKISDLKINTYSDPQRLFSCRRSVHQQAKASASEAVFGVQLSTIKLIFSP